MLEKWGYICIWIKLHFVVVIRMVQKCDISLSSGYVYTSHFVVLLKSLMVRSVDLPSEWQLLCWTKTWECFVFSSPLEQLSLALVNWVKITQSRDPGNFNKHVVEPKISLYCLKHWNMGMVYVLLKHNPAYCNG